MYYLPQDHYFVAYTRYAGCSFPNTGEFLNCLAQLFSSNPEACTFYEVILRDYPVYEFYDLDHDDFGEQTPEEYLQWFLTQRKNFRDNFSMDSVRVKIARGKKKSVHLIIKDCIWTILDLKNFVTDFVAAKGVRCDRCIYHHYRLIRTPLSTKEDGDVRTFEPQGGHPLREYFVQLDLRGGHSAGHGKLQIHESPLQTDRACPRPVWNATLKTLFEKIKTIYPEFKDPQPTENAGIFHLERNREGPCPSRKHEVHHRENAWVMITQTEVYIACYTHRHLCYVGTYRKLTKLEKIQNQIEYNCNLLDNSAQIEPLKQAQLVKSKYISNHQIQLQKGITCIKSSTGSGKSTFMNAELAILNDHHPGARMLCLSFRQSFAYFMSAVLGFDNYLDTANVNIHKSKRLILSVEQLWRLKHPESYEVLILDEFVMLTDQLNSKATCKENLYGSQRTFIELVQKSKYIIVLDANITEHHISFLNNIRNNQTPIHVYQNIELTPTRECVISYSKEGSLRYIRDLLLQGKKIVIPYTISRNELKALERMFTTEEYKGLVISRDTQDKDKIFADLTTVSTEYSFIGYTQSLTAGVSVENPDYQDVVALIGRHTTNPPQIIQMLNRFRNVKRVLLYLDNSRNEKPIFDTDDEIEDFLRKDLQENGFKQSSVCSDIYDHVNAKFKDDPCKHISFLKYRLDGYYYADYNGHLFRMLRENRWNVIVDQNNYNDDINPTFTENQKLIAQEIRGQEIQRIADTQENADRYGELKNMLTRSPEDEDEYQKIKFIKTFKVNPEMGDLVSLMKKFHHSRGYAQYYKFKNLLKIQENPLIDRYRSTDRSLIPTGTERTKYFLLQVFPPQINMDVVNLIYDFWGDDISNTLGYTQVHGPDRCLEFYNEDEISIDTVHTRYKLALGWIQELGFRGPWDSNTELTQEARDSFVIRTCTQYSDPERYKFICTVFGQQSKRFKQFKANLFNQNYTELSKFIFSKIEAVLGVVQIKRKQIRRDGSRINVYHIHLDTGGIQVYTQHGEKPCLYREAELSNISSDHKSILKLVQSKC